MMTEREEAAKTRGTSMGNFNYLLLDADKVLTAFGKYGRYQMLTYFITNSVQLLFSANMMVMPFITKRATFDCHFAPKDEWTYTILSNDSCHVLDGNNWQVPCSSIPGYSYAYNQNVSTMASEFGLVCDDYNSIEHSTSIFLLGGMLVTPLITQLSDIFGRRIAFLVPLYTSVIANIICAIAPNYTIFLIFRFFSGVATTSFAMTGYVLCMESVALDFHSFIPLLSSLTWVLGYILAGVFDMFISNWRWLYFAVSLPGILTIPFYWFTPESLHWLVNNKKERKIERYIAVCSHYNKMEIPLHNCRNDSQEEQVGIKRTVFDVFSHPTLLVNILLNSFILVIMNGTYWALSLFSVDLSEDEHLGYFLSGLIELPAGGLSVILLICCDRKLVSFFSLLSTAVFMLCTIYVPIEKNIRMIFPLLAKSANSIAWSSQPLLYTEATPTTVRNVVCGIIAFIGDIGSVAAPYLKRMEAVSVNAPTILISALSVIAAFCVVLLPETKGRKLPEDLNDFDLGPLLRCFAPKNEAASEEEVVEHQEEQNTQPEGDHNIV
ncbi:unnamed protein product [Caenorhabditis bovis]|uniref:Major facilitator superfamily (MFS) profile domain-containing protein n=1 Tax=Caenorhabditis bovis TaxID=2654633 RepID=A0A8S1EDN9_9PELO|nr:unnamed protein product [Caenorhabditis bovis]